MIPAPQRKLAAIVFTDISGYTALSAKDSITAANLLRVQRETIKPIVEKHNGEWLKEIGDGLLLTFNSATAAVECAIDIQRQTREIEHLNLRIAVHEGEVIIENGDVIGDDVNVASRIEPFSAIGGIAISQKVEQAISSNPGITTKYIGSPKLKGVTQRVKLYCIIADEITTATVISTMGIKSHVLIGSIGILLLTFLLIKQFSGPIEIIEKNSIKVQIPEIFSEIKHPRLNRKLAQDLIVGLSNYSAGEIIIPSNINKQNMSQVNTEFVLESSLSFKGDQIEFWCRLLNSKTGKSIYARKLNIELKNLPVLVNAISLGVINAMEIEIAPIENTQPTNLALTTL